MSVFGGRSKRNRTAKRIPLIVVTGVGGKTEVDEKIDLTVLYSVRLPKVLKKEYIKLYPKCVIFEDQIVLNSDQYAVIGGFMKNMKCIKGDKAGESYVMLSTIFLGIESDFIEEMFKYYILKYITLDKCQKMLVKLINTKSEGVNFKPMIKLLVDLFY